MTDLRGTAFEKYSRQQIQQFVKDGICSYQTLRDYDILMSGKTRKELSHETGLSETSVSRIRSKYMKGKPL